MVLLLLSMLILPGALGLRASRAQEPQVPPEEGAVGFEKDRGTETGLPRLLKQYSDRWEERYKMETHLWDAKPSSIRLVLGITTTLDVGEYREVIRRTWLNQSGVCYAGSKPRHGCSVYVAFVYGARGVKKNARNNPSPRRNLTAAQREQAKHEPGMLELDIEENNNDGKNFVWMSTALSKFPWATHIGKIDMDTYPFVSKLLTRMSQNASCAERTSPYQIIGRPAYTCHGKDPDGTKCAFRHRCSAADCLGQFHSKLDSVRIGAPWQFPFGELYILSMPLMRIVDWTPIHGNEDCMVAVRMDEAVGRAGSCAAFRRLDAHVHQVNPDITASFANDA